MRPCVSRDGLGEAGKNQKHRNWKQTSAGEIRFMFEIIGNGIDSEQRMIAFGHEIITMQFVHLNGPVRVRRGARGRARPPFANQSLIDQLVPGKIIIINWLRVLHNNYPYCVICSRLRTFSSSPSHSLSNSASELPLHCAIALPGMSSTFVHCILSIFFQSFHLVVDIVVEDFLIHNSWYSLVNNSKWLIHLRSSFPLAIDSCWAFA